MSRPRQVTRGWTEIHTGVALCFALAVTAGLLGGTESGLMRVAVPALALVCLAAALFFDAFVGVVLGLAAAAGAVLLKRSLGVWDREQFSLAVATAACLLVLGWAAGFVGTRIRRTLRTADASGADARPVFGAMGLLAEDRARPRLDDEILRARAHRRSLGLMIVHVQVIDPNLDEPARQAVHRAIARLVESLLRDVDVPFALSPDEFGAILPETDAAQGWSVVGPLVDAAARSTFTDRAAGGRRSVSDCAEISAGLAFLSGEDSETDGADAMIARARAARGAQVMV
ncbi:GGDEF domain-containing protein [Rhodococcus sp. HNM0569]|uniref:GGDEF domain-containing protein n=1 Tax=Rhodococcus sp. HNM0569 TaxID=2716340 RepID=UPI00146C62B7|nr:GGDEF domain-containing protein [Rhodococcus sp. HNM0569]NLU83811.1 GGDEF domain-containing protein [Rhodococcus sp. HNM0569]